MNRTQAIQHHLDNLFVYAREYRLDGRFDVYQVTEQSEKEADRRYFLEAKQSVIEQLSHLPGDILLASTERRVATGKMMRPLAIMVVEGENKGISAKEHSVYETVKRKGTIDYTALHDSDTRRAVTQPEFANRRAVITLNWQRITPDSVSRKRLRGEGNNYPLIHEMGHHWLDCCLTAQEKRRFLKAFLEAVEKDKAHIAPALHNRVNQHEWKRHYNTKEEYFTYALEALCGGDKKKTGTKKAFFDFEQCPNVLDCLLAHHPDWIDKVNDVTPVFAARWKDRHGIPQQLNDSWAEAIRAEEKRREEKSGASLLHR